MTIKEKKYKIVFHRGRPLTKALLIAMITLCTVALVVIHSNIKKAEARLDESRTLVLAQEQEKKDVNGKIDRLGSQESIVEIAANELGLYPRGTIIVDTE